MTYVDLNTIHNPATGSVAPASWGDGVRDNDEDLNARTTPAQASVATSQTTTSLTYTDLATVVSVTIVTGTQAKVTVGCQASNSTAGSGALMSFAVSGATTVAAADNRAFGPVLISGAAPNVIGSRTFLVTGLTAGTNVFTPKCRAVTGGTAAFQDRQIFVEPANKLA